MIVFKAWREKTSESVQTQEMERGVHVTWGDDRSVYVPECHGNHPHVTRISAAHFFDLLINQTKTKHKTEGGLYRHWKKSFLSPWTLGRVRFSSLNFETDRLASSDSRNRSCDILERVWGRFYYFSFIFILTKSLKKS